MATDHTTDATLQVGVALGRLFAAAEDAAATLRETYSTANKATADRLTAAVATVEAAMGLKADPTDAEAEEGRA